jgi:hypothetical protein
MSMLERCPKVAFYKPAPALPDTCEADPFSVVASLIRGEFSLPSQLIRL